MSTTYQIPMLQDASPASTDAAVKTIDTSLTEIQSALNDLSGRVDNLNTKSAVIRQHVPLAAGVLIGDLVYYNANLDQDLESRRGEYAKAQALTLAETTTGGQTIEAPCARTEGMVIATDSGSSPLTGTLLVGGYWEDQGAADNCLGSTASPGIYYLSPTLAGKATLNTYGHLRQPVLSYYGNGAFSLSLFYMAHDNHFHSSQVLQSVWDDVSDVVIGGQTAYYKYGGDTAPGLGGLGDTTAVFYNGVLQNTTGSNTLFKIYNGELYYMDGTEPTGVVTVFNHYPFAYESAIVKSIYSTSAAITVKNTNGQVAITGNDFIQGITAKSSQAIYSVNGRELNYTPVITDVVAGPGINVRKSLDGTAVVAASTNVGGLMDAYSINHNGTTLISDAGNPPLQYITFPAGQRASNFVMYLPVHDIGDAVCNVAVWGIKLGTETATLNVSAKFIPDPTATAQSSTSGEANTRSMVISGGSSSTALTYDEVEITGCTVQGSGMLVAVVGCTNSANQVQLLRTGFRLSVAEASDITDTSDIMNGITQTMTVATGETIHVGDAVMISNGLLLKCTNYKTSLADNTNKCVGIAMDDATEGQQLTYMITGTMTFAVTAEPGQSLYIQPNGTIGAVADVDDFMTTARYLQKVGTALTGNKIQVNIESAVRG